MFKLALVASVLAIAAIRAAPIADQGMNHYYHPKRNMFGFGCPGCYQGVNILAHNTFPNTQFIGSGFQHTTVYPEVSLTAGSANIYGSPVSAPQQPVAPAPVPEQPVAPAPVQPCVEPTQAPAPAPAPTPEQPVRFVCEYMKKYDCSHDWHHVQRVVRQALALAKIEQENKTVDLEIVHLAALLHDVNDAKYKDDGEEPFSCVEFLVSIGVNRARAEIVGRIVDSVSFRKELLAAEHDKMGITSSEEREWRRDCVELACVQDADRLDAIGAFGVLRCAAFSGARNRPLYDPNDQAADKITYAQYVHQSSSATGTAVSHFHEKLLKLALMMKTKRGKQEAERRHTFMINFLQQLDDEFRFGQEDNSLDSNILEASHHPIKN
ncbi:hypothetical protein H4S08_001327 [Coemansia sp. RSA 1365]|nr:hypothetical protein H4S08_001327 [Coemansia sp. RSA 1365]